MARDGSYIFPVVVTFKTSNRSNARVKQKVIRNKNVDEVLDVNTKIPGIPQNAIILSVRLAKSFIENPENKPDINHIDGNKLNNTVDNIEWCTKAENARHSRDVLKSACYDKGHESIFSVLTEQERNYVIANYKPKDKKYGARAMSRELGVTHHTILKVLNRLGKGKTIC